jgi:hypothetical protein
VLNQKSFRTAWLILVFSVLPIWCVAGLAHNNQLVIQKEQPQALRIEFTVNPRQMLHQWLAPSIPFETFLQKYTALTDEAFQKELTKAVKKFESDSFVVQASGVSEGLEKEW